MPASEARRGLTRAGAGALTSAKVTTCTSPSQQSGPGPSLPAGKHFSTISEIIWRAEPKICEAICYECSSLLNTYRVTGGYLNIFYGQCNHRHSWFVAARSDGGVTDRVQNLFTSAPTKMRSTRLFVAMCANLHFAKCKTHFV